MFLPELLSCSSNQAAPANKKHETQLKERVTSEYKARPSHPAIIRAELEGLDNADRGCWRTSVDKCTGLLPDIYTNERG